MEIKNDLICKIGTLFSFLLIGIGSVLDNIPNKTNSVILCAYIFIFIICFVILICIIKIIKSYFSKQIFIKIGITKFDVRLYIYNTSKHNIYINNCSVIYYTDKKIATDMKSKLLDFKDFPSSILAQNIQNFDISKKNFTDINPYVLLINYSFFEKPKSSDLHQLQVQFSNKQIKQIK